MSGLDCFINDTCDCFDCMRTNNYNLTQDDQRKFDNMMYRISIRDIPGKTPKDKDWP